jgi:hypothetical protein
MTISQILPHIRSLHHSDKLRLMQTLLLEIAHEEGIRLDDKNPEKTTPQFTWEGGLAELSQEYSSLDLQKKALEWR